MATMNYLEVAIINIFLKLKLILTHQEMCSRHWKKALL